jgi:hypothetical protein
VFVDSMAGVWKHAVSGLHSLEDGGGAPALAPPVGTNPLFEQVANAAGAGLKTHPEVMSAQVTIDGDGQRARVQLDCVVGPSGDLARIADLIDSSVLGPLEILLGSEFAAVVVRIHRQARRNAA